MKKVLVFLVLSLLFGSVSFAQVKVGVTAGLNASNFVEDGIDESAFNTNRYGFLGGLVFDLGITKSFSIIPELLYIQKGAGISAESNDGGSIKIMVNLDYVQIPVNFAYKLNMGSSAKLLLFAGPYFGYAISGKNTVEAKINGEKQKESEDVKFGTEDDEMNPLDIGFNIGLGVQVGKGFFKFQVIPGLSNLNNDDSSYKLNNGGVAFSLGYFF